MRASLHLYDSTLLTENREYIYHAAMPDSHAAAELDLIQIRVLVDDLIAAHADWLPRWITEEKAD